MMYPHGVYIAMNLTRDSRRAIRDYMEKNIPNIEMNDDLHSTIIYSKKPHEKRIERIHDEMHAGCKGFAKYGDDEESLVIELDSDDLKKHNKKRTEEYGFISDFDEYKPHISISYKGKEVDLSKLPPITFDIDLEHEIVEGLDKEEEEKEDDDVMDAQGMVGFVM